MEKEDKERAIFELRLKEIEALDRDSTSLSIKMIFGVFALSGALYSLGIPFSIVIWVFVTLLFSVTWMGQQTYVYITDVYDKFSEAVKNNRLYEFHTWQMSFWDNFRYKKR